MANRSSQLPKMPSSLDERKASNIFVTNASAVVIFFALNKYGFLLSSTSFKRNDSIFDNLLA
jgi:hypothetical protein